MAKINDISITILEDGSIRVDTGSFDEGLAHMNADQLMTFLAEQLGGEVVIERAGTVHAHTHEHMHEHGLQHAHGKLKH